jgi:hypothetical protein
MVCHQQLCCQLRLHWLRLQLVVQQLRWQLLGCSVLQAVLLLVQLQPPLQPQLPGLHSARLLLLLGACLELPAPALGGPLLLRLLLWTALLLSCRCLA